MPSNHSRNAARAVPSVHNQNDRHVEQLGNLRCAAFLRTPGYTVEKSHHSFDYSNIATRRSTGENLAISFGAEHPRIEIARGSARRHREMAAIDEVRAALEWLHCKLSRP
jgi:hypothetical protein